MSSEFILLLIYYLLLRHSRGSLFHIIVLDQDEAERKSERLLLRSYLMVDVRG